jgi:hypothetical protein
MRDIILAAGSLAGAAVLTALAAIVQPESPIWKWILWTGISVFIACASILIVDYFRPGGRTIFLLGMGAGIALFMGCAIAFYAGPITDQSMERGEIMQAGIAVGKTFGARRLPSDAAMFEFAEIMNCGQFNTRIPFVYNGIQMQFISEKNSVLIEVSRLQDSPIRFGVLAKILN